MSASSSVALLTVASPSLASAGECPDTELIHLGRELETAWSIEREAWERLNRIDDRRLYEPLRTTLAYDPNSNTDQHIVSLIERNLILWTAGSSFTPTDIDKLRNLESTGDQHVDRRIQELTAARKLFDQLLNRPEVHALDSQAEAAAKITGDIVKRIEQAQASTIAGLRVKAMALAWCYAGDDAELDEFPGVGSTDLRLARSILRDLAVLNARVTA